jgi:serine protease Do
MGSGPQRPPTVVSGDYRQAGQPAPSYRPVSQPQGGGSPQDVIARTRGSVVLILAEGPEGLSSGTGFVVSSQQVATCEHVIEGARAIYLLTGDGRRLQAAVAAADPLNDVAVLTVRGGLPPPMQLGSFSQAREGDEVAVTGFPESFSMQAVGFSPTPSTSRGSISSKRYRMVDGARVAILQTDAAVNPGNSGGPLYSLRDGTVVGIAAATMRDAQGLNFASSIDSLRRLLGR